MMGNCGFGVAPTRAAHRGLILRTLEKVEGMSLEALQAGLGSDWPFETFPQYLDAIERHGMAINVAVLIGHTPVRLYVMGEAATERAATADEVAQMRTIVRDAIDAGALGFATSKAPTHVGYAGKPVPSRVAELSEIEALAGVLREAGRGIVQATVGPGLFFDEFASLARASGRTVTWTALLAGMLGPGSGRMLLERSVELIRQGFPVVPQVSCRPLNFDFDFAEPFPFESLPTFAGVSAADRAGKMRIYRDPAFRQTLKETFAIGDGRPVHELRRAHLDLAVTARSRLGRAHDCRGGARARRRRGGLPARSGARLEPGGALPHGHRQLRRRRGCGPAARPAHGARALRCRRARQPAVRCVLLDAPARALGAGEGDAATRGGGAHADLASRRSGRPQPTVAGWPSACRRMS